MENVSKSSVNYFNLYPLTLFIDQYEDHISMVQAENLDLWKEMERANSLDFMDGFLHVHKEYHPIIVRAAKKWLSNKTVNPPNTPLPNIRIEANDLKRDLEKKFGSLIPTFTKDLIAQIWNTLALEERGGTLEDLDIGNKHVPNIVFSSENSTAFGVYNPESHMITMYIKYFTQVQIQELNKSINTYLALIKED